jgi:hypothetical protein
VSAKEGAGGRVAQMRDPDGYLVEPFQQTPMAHA